MTRAWIGLGSNLDDPLAQLQRAVHALAALPDTQISGVSPVYRNPAMLLVDQPAQPDYFNAVAGIDTTLLPLELLAALQTIELAQGRTRERRWGPRTLDLDLLLYGSETLDLPHLTVPHPGLRERNFVLQPLHDLAPNLVLPEGAAVAALLAQCPRTPLSLAGKLT